MKQILRTGLALAACLLAANAFAQTPYVVDGVDLTRVEYEQFRDPAREFRGVRFISLSLDRATEESMRAAVERDFKTDKWGTFVLIAGGGNTAGLSDEYLQFSGRKRNDRGVAYLSEDYFKLYRAAIEKGLELGFKCSTLYDEWEYPSGMVEGLFYSKYPQDCAKSLEMEEQDVSGKAQRVTLSLPEGGLYVGAVAMNLDTWERRDVSKDFKDGVLTCRVPAGRWKVMLFWLDPAFAPRSSKGGFVDYLDREAVAKYIDMSFGAYYAHLSEFFGTVIERTFYDEPTMMLNNGRMWTPGFNAGFKARYGYDPMILYPALWYDIGEETAAARNALFGYRADLFAENYIGQVAEWCHAHGIKSGGHLDQEETRNPVGPNGDLMKAFKYQDVPATDDIYYPGRSNVGYKIVSSSAWNWDKPEMFTETFAAYSRPQYAALTPENYMRVSLDQMTMGTNIQIEFEQKFEGVDHFLGRGGYMLRGGRHVADIAVLYPIASLQAAFRFPSKSQNGHYYAYMGGILPPETDYMDVGESLFRGLRVDYTYLHPEVLVEKCSVEGKELYLDNVNNWERFKVLVLPGGEVLSADAAARILEFFRAGGTVIATSKLPRYSAESGRDQEVRDMVYEVFGMSDIRPMTCSVRHAHYRFLNIFTQRGEAGGRGYFIAKPYTSVLEEVLAEVLPQRDVDLGLDPEYYVRMDHDYAGAVTYIHKVRGGKDIYFIANSTDAPVSLQVRLRGEKQGVELWDPHTGERSLPQDLQLVEAAARPARAGAAASGAAPATAPAGARAAASAAAPAGPGAPASEAVTAFPLTLPERSGMFVVAQ